MNESEKLEEISVPAGKVTGDDGTSGVTDQPSQQRRPRRIFHAALSPLVVRHRAGGEERKQPSRFQVSERLSQTGETPRPGVPSSKRIHQQE